VFTNAEGKGNKVDAAAAEELNYILRNKKKSKDRK